MTKSLNLKTSTDFSYRRNDKEPKNRVKKDGAKSTKFNTQVKTPSGTQSSILKGNYMTQNEILEKTKSFMAQFINVNVADDEDIFASGLVNSLFAMQLVLFIEKEFSIKVENEDLDYDNFRTLNAIVGFIERKI
jgi:acyl carrier protein